ncbi:MAG: glycosyltransferase [Lachnospiraceae bacterium]|nr:glycosyltransferase [Lachnospiraceae bacterium]
MPDYIESKVLLTVGILVSNRIKYIEKCMESIKPLLSTGFCELVAVDTLKEEEINEAAETVKKYTDKVYKFPWCKDFSAARNVCLEHAEGEWFLYFDDDEVFGDLTELVNFFTSGEYKNYGSGFYNIHNLNKDGSYSSAVMGRMVRRTRNTRFVGKVHEAFNEVNPPRKYFSFYADHYGYIFENEEARKKHKDRNVALLLEEIEKYGYTPRLAAQYAQELLAYPKTKEEGYKFCLEKAEDLKREGKLEDPLSQWILLASVRYFNEKKDLAGMMERVRYIEANFNTSHAYRLCQAAVVGTLAGEMGDVSLMKEYVPKYFAEYDHFSENSGERLTETQLDMSRYFEDTYYVQMAYIGAVLANAYGDYLTANKFWKRFPWNRIKDEDKRRYMKDMQATLDGLKNMQ